MNSYTNTCTNKYNFTQICNFLYNFFCTSQCNSMLFCLSTITVICQRYQLCETESSMLRAKRVEKAKLEELSNNISERRGLPSR